VAIPDGTYVQGTAEFELADGTIAQNVFHFLCDFTSDQSGSSVVAAVVSYIEDIYNDVATYLSDGFTVNLTPVHSVVWDEETANWVIHALIGSALPSITHTNTDDPFPNQIAPVLVANTGRPKTRGRKFLMGFVETAALGGDLVTAAVTALSSALGDYLADETVSGDSLLSPGVLRDGVEVFEQFTDGEVNTVVGTQRRRKPGIGG
jgi:hypothetical protein